MTTELSSLDVRSRIHAALGDPGRLAIADMLALGDASPKDVAAKLGMTTNLVAHHLNVLAAAGVIERHQSEHDRRRSYIQLRGDALAALRLPKVARPPRVVFVCTRNSARSQLAAALWTRHSPIPVASAGTEPSGVVNPRAVSTAQRHGLAIDATRTHRLDEVATSGDLLIAVCDHVHETLPADQTRLHWSVPDPVAAGTDEAFEDAYTDLEQRITRIAPTLSEEHPS